MLLLVLHGIGGHGDLGGILIGATLWIQVQRAPVLEVGCSVVWRYCQWDHSVARWTPAAAQRSGIRHRQWLFARIAEGEDAAFGYQCIDFALATFTIVLSQLGIVSAAKVASVGQLFQELLSLIHLVVSVFDISDVIR